MRDVQGNRGEKSRKRLLLLVIAGGVVLVLGVGVVVLVNALIIEPARLERELEAHRAAGAPLTMQEALAKYPEVSDEANAALLYEQAFALLMTFDADYAQLEALRKALPEPWLGAPMPPELRESLREYLEERADVMALLHEAAALPEARYPVRITGKGFEDLFLDRPDLLELRVCGTLLCYSAELALHDGKPGEAVEHLRAAIRLADSLAGYPEAVIQLMHRILFVIPARSLKAALGVGGFDHAALVELLALFDRDESIRESVRVEVQDGPMLVHAVVKNQEQTYDDASLYARNQRLLLEHAHETLKDAQLPWWEWYTASRNYPAEDFLLHPAGIEPRGFKRAVAQSVQTVALLRLVRAAILVERHRLQHGAPLDELAALSPELAAQWPLDPYDGAPLRYVLDTEAYRIYSVGENQRDDGGSDAEGPTEPDLVYRVFLND